MMQEHNRSGPSVLSRKFIKEVSAWGGLSILAVPIFFAMTQASAVQAHESGSREPQALPASCQDLRKSNQRVRELLADVERHATTDAYNALGVVYAEGSKLNCAVSAFEEALRLDDQDWR